jgi:hypothetical protein
MQPDEYLQKAQLHFEAAQKKVGDMSVSKDGAALKELSAGLIQLTAALRAKWKNE